MTGIVLVPLLLTLNVFHTIVNFEHVIAGCSMSIPVRIQLE